MEGNPAASTDWELQKENIKPLSHGRNITILKHSLETSIRNMADYEEETDLQVKSMEDLARSYNGKDPLEPWLNLINFLENSCLLVAKLKVKLNAVLKEVTRIFHANRQYWEDKRYLEVYMKSMADVEPSKRVQIFRISLQRGLGIHCSNLYLAIAELEESSGKHHEAVKTLRGGIEKEAQPMDVMKDALNQLEYRVAQRLAESVFSEMGSAAAAANSRNFGSSVPVYGPSNEAPAFRTDLQSAVPVSSTKQAHQTRQGLKQIEVFPCATPNSDEIILSRNNPVETVVHQNEENNPRPSKWNKPDAAFETESTRIYVEVPRDRISVYVDSSEENSTRIPKKMPSVQEGVLKERSALVDRPATATVQEEHIDVSCNVIVRRDPAEFQPLKMACSEEFYLKSAAVSAGRRNPRSIEQRYMDIWLKKEKAKMTETEQLASRVKELETFLASKEQEYKDGLISRQEECSRIESKLKSKISECHSLTEKLQRESKTNENLRSEFAQKEDEYMKKLEELSSYLSLIKTKCEELEDQLKAKNDELTALQQQQQVLREASSSGTSSTGPSSAECTFLPRPSTPTINSNEDRMVDQKGRDTIFGGSMDGVGLESFSHAEESNFLPPPMPAKKMAFTLYESHLGSSFANKSRVGNVSIYPRNSANGENQNIVDFHQLSENIPPPIEVEVNQENENSKTQKAAQDPVVETKCKEPKYTGVNFSTPPSKRRYTYTSKQAQNSHMIEPDDEVRNLTSPDFNLSNLTHALAFHPEPLLNSTPERVTAGYASQYEHINVGNYIHTQRLPQLRNFVDLQSHRIDDEIEGPLSPGAKELARITGVCTEDEANPLSPIQETSKENRSNCTTGSSSGNMTSTRGTTISGVSYNSTQATRLGSALRSISRSNNYH